MASLNLEGGEEEGVLLPIDLELQSSTHEYYLVGGFFTTSVVHFSAMKNTMANLWHPLKGVQISNIGAKRFLFRFFHEIDIDRVVKGTLLGHLTITF
ncbi:hypothetical protein Golax_018444 [Gossypium laxum]|uniref:DUF4283 domain-containing protein n=1 Tax=Gossypium laxum TaxID=34288 RepID=A0A7J8Z392_9ROSI|nr:hypothetical protein [Gossypium laxum]